MRDLAGAALLLHDLARFYQFHRDRVISMDHGLVATQMLRIRFNENNPFVLLPIKYHDKLSLTDLFTDVDFLALTDAKKEIALLLVNLVRDADKLDNYIRHNKIGEIQRLGNINHSYTFSDEVLLAISQRRAVNIAKVKGSSMFDFIAFLMCWQYDFAFSSSHIITKKYNMNQFFISELKRHAKIGYEMKDNPDVKISALQYSKILEQINLIEKMVFDNLLL